VLTLGEKINEFEELRLLLARQRVIPVKVGIQLIQQAPHCGTKPNGILNNSTGFRPSPE